MSADPDPYAFEVLSSTYSKAVVSYVFGSPLTHQQSSASGSSRGYLRSILSPRSTTAKGVLRMGAWRGWMVDRKIRETKQIVTGQLVEVHLSPLSRSP